MTYTDHGPRLGLISPIHAATGRSTSVSPGVFPMLPACGKLRPQCPSRGDWSLETWSVNPRFAVSMSVRVRSAVSKYECLGVGQ